MRTTRPLAAVAVAASLLLGCAGSQRGAGPARTTPAAAAPAQAPAPADHDAVTRPEAAPQPGQGTPP